MLIFKFKFFIIETSLFSYENDTFLKTRSFVNISSFFSSSRVFLSSFSNNSSDKTFKVGKPYFREFILVFILLISGINLTTAAKNKIDVSKPKISTLLFVFNRYKRNKIINNSR